jgi:transposase-like protein
MAIIPHWTRDDGERWVAAWRQSGKSRSAFAREHDLPSHRLHYWTAAESGRDIWWSRGHNNWW